VQLPSDVPQSAAEWEFFAGSDPDVLGFHARIRLWQASERLAEATKRQLALEGPPQGPDSKLQAALVEFRQDLKERIVARTLGFVQRASRVGYRRDVEGEDWPILDELLAGGRDDCDGWELLTFSVLREQGFVRGEIYRAILRSRRGSDAQVFDYHMVTFWFSAVRPGDPWVLDPTGFLARKPTRLSKLRDWEPVRIFDESDQFSVMPRTPSSAQGAAKGSEERASR